MLQNKNGPATVADRRAAKHFVFVAAKLPLEEEFHCELNAPLSAAAEHGVAQSHV
jgi:hypothetical protein